MNHPSIFQVGKVTDDGTTVVIHGWGIGLCAAGCHCHRHPTGGFLAIADDWINGTVGLVSWRDGCDCCQPWTADESRRRRAGPGRHRRDTCHPRRVD